MNLVGAKIKQIIRPFFAKPWHSPIMEFRYGLWSGVSALFSEGGRQLGEENTRPFVLNHHLPAETIACKYQGSRNGRMINISALRIAMKYFDKALAITGAVRQFHLEKVGRTSQDASPGIWDLYIISRASIAIIAYKERYHGHPSTDKTVSNPLTSQYQFISGVFMICREMMNTADTAIKENHPISAMELYSYTDDNDIFLSPNGMACAGGVAKIMEFLEFCNSGMFELRKPGVISNNETNTIIDLETIVPNPENWYRYAISTIELDCFIELEHLRRQTILYPDRAAHFKKVQEIYQSVSRYCTGRIEFPTVSNGTSQFTKGVLERQNNILALLGRPLINKISEKYITERLCY